jgi:hypothetical protein
MTLPVNGLRASLLACVVLCATPRLAHAQWAVGVTAAARGCTAVVVLKEAAKEDLFVIVEVNGVSKGDDVIRTPKTTVTVALGLRLAPKDVVRIKVSDGTRPPVMNQVEVSEPAKDAPRPANEGCPKDESPDRSYDGRGVIDMLAYAGMAIDTFAPAKLGDYPDANGDAGTQVKSRVIGGIDFSYRVTRKAWPVQIWISGETLYGARTGDFCKDKDEGEGEEKVEGEIEDKCVAEALKLGTVPRVIRSATSMEAYITPRVEFWTLQKDSDHPAALYGTARFGLIALGGAPGISGAHHVGFGGIITKGIFEGSLFEVGWGKTELFLNPDDGKAKWNRLKIDGLLGRELGKGVYLFVQLYVDTTLDPADQSSGVQTFFGLEYDLTKFGLLK